MSPLEPSNHTTVAPDYRNIAEAQEKTSMNITEVLKEEINKLP